MSDGELLRRILRIDGFFHSAFVTDDLQDWILAHDFAVLLLRLGHDDLMAHLLLARAYRHLGEKEKAASEVGRCHFLLQQGKIETNEREALSKALVVETDLTPFHRR